MKPAILLLLLSVTVTPAVLAQQAASVRPSTQDVRKIGQQLFHQRCSVCHLPPAHSEKTYGPRLYKDMIDANEDAMREAILNGRPERMPGWKYTLQPQQIDSIIEYLKTVERPSHPAS